MSTVIKVENLSKQYRLGTVGVSTFREDAHRWFSRIRGKVDPYIHLGVENDRTIQDDSKFVWSLKDINFEVKQGDVLGVVGRNGAGKSTLLKILSKVTAPTTGSVKVKGRIASLLEVGTGFHPELTGRENIYLNGAILGMRKHEISRKLDEIIAFAGVEKYVDTPVKRYSSGMYVRLAFAVAAHLESEILIVDEVLAVGDGEFQKKCLGKMGDISQSDGKTIFFVSHNLAAVQTLCNNALYLDKGNLLAHSNVETILDKYLSIESHERRCLNKLELYENDYVKLVAANITNEMIDGVNSKIYLSDDIFIQFTIQNFTSETELNIGFDLKTVKDDVIFGSASNIVFDAENKSTIICKIPKKLLNYGVYKLDFFVHTTSISLLYSYYDLLTFQINDEKRENGYLGDVKGFFKINLAWNQVNK